MSETTEDDDLWNEAMALLLSWQAEPGNEAVRRSIREFCARDDAHRLAWEEAKRVYRLSGEAIDLEAGRQRRITRRRLIGGGIGVVVAGGSWLAAPGLWRQWRADVTTRVAETRRERLADGSWLTLGPETAIRIDYSEGARRVELLDGMALCEVAPDRDRPFAVRAGALTAGASDAAFEVQCNGRRSLVGVAQGNVAIAVGAAAPLSLSDGEWLSHDPADGRLERGRRETGQIAAWRRGMLVAENETVSSVVEEIGRWRGGGILVPQRGLAAARVSGLFDLGDPDAALAAAVAPYGGKLRHLSPWLVVVTTL